MATRIKRQNITTKEMTWGQAVNLYLEERERYNIAYTTLKNYRSIIDKYARTFDIKDDTSIADATTHTPEEFIDILKAQGNKATTINANTRAINTFFKWMAQANMIRVYTPTKLLRVEDELPRFLSEDEIDKLMGSPYNRNDFVESRTYTISALMLATGIRVGSVPEIRVEDWNRDEGTILLRKTKTKKQQLIYLPASAKEVLDRYFYDYIYKTNIKYLFPNSYGEQVAVYTLEMAYNRFVKKRGINNTKIHSLRHTAAYYYIRNGGNIYRLQKMLNHSIVESTMRYGRLFDEDVIKDFQDMSILNDYVGIKVQKRRKQAKARLTYPSSWCMLPPGKEVCLWKSLIA